MAPHVHGHHSNLLFHFPCNQCKGEPAKTTVSKQTALGFPTPITFERVYRARIYFRTVSDIQTVSGQYCFLQAGLVDDKGARTLAHGGIIKLDSTSNSMLGLLILPTTSMRSTCCPITQPSNCAGTTEITSSKVTRARRAKNEKTQRNQKKNILTVLSCIRFLRSSENNIIL